MSDTSGVNLEGDMPGVGTAETPPVTGNARSPLPLPSALQGLVRSFGMMGQGQPKPKPKPPPLTEEEARQPPPGTGGPASFSPFPPTQPPPPPQFSQYMKPADSRHFSQWGEVPGFQRLPQTFELPGMFAQLGNFFAQAGGPIAEAANALSGSNREYLEGYMRGAEFHMRQALEKQALAAKMLDENITRGMVEYKNTHNAYWEAAGRDPAKLATTTIGGMNLYDAEHAKALELNDEQLIPMFEQGIPLETIEKVIDDRDKNQRALWAARQKASDQQDADSTYDLKPREQENAWEPGGPAQPAGTPPAAAAPAPGPAKTAQAGASDAAPAPAPAPEEDTPEIFKGISPELRQAGESLYMGEQPAGLTAKGGSLHNARIISDKMREQAEEILQDKTIKPGEYVDAVRKRLGGRVASELQGIEDYSNPALTSGTGSRSHAGYLVDLQNIAAKDMPGDASGKGRWNAANFKLREEFNKDRSIVTTLTRTNDMASALTQTGVLLDRIHNELKKRGMKDTQVNLAAIADVLGGGTYATLNSQLNNFAAAYNAILSSGHITVTGQQIVASDLTASYRPLSSVRDIIKTHIPTAQGILKGIHNNWEARGGGPNPMFDAESEKTIDDWGKVDIKTGVRPGMIVLHKFRDGHTGKAQWTGVNPVEREADENWIEQ